MKTRRKYVCLLLTVCLALGLLPGAALAQESEARYSIDGGNTWTESSLIDAIYALYNAALIDGVSSGQIELNQDIVLTGANWGEGCVLAMPNFDLAIDGKGHTLKRGQDIRVLGSVNTAGSVVTLKNIVLDGGAVWEGDDPATRVNTGLSFRGTSSLLFVEGGGKLILDSGAVLQNSHLTGEKMYGAAVSLGADGSGTLVMKAGAEIKNNAVYTGAVYVWENGTFIMEGGKISGNYAENNSGAVNVAQGVMEMSGGEISGNKAGAGGGGVTVFNQNATLTMTGGSITGNAIDGSLGGGVLVLNGNLTVSGTPVIADNTGKDGVPNNAYLASGKTITIESSGLSNGASIGITTADDPSASAPVHIVNNTSRDTYQPYFASDKGYAFNTDDGQTIQLGDSHITHVYGTVWQSNETEHWQVCTVCGQGETNRANHSAGSDLEHDEDSHWHVCTVCGAACDEEAHTLTWVTDKDPTEAAPGSKHEECTVCGYAKAPVEIPALPAPTATPTPAPTSTAAVPATSNTNVPKTGDNAPLALWLVLLLASGTAAAVLGKRRLSKR